AGRAARVPSGRPTPRMSGTVDVRDLVPDWDGPWPLRIRFTRNRTVLASCGPRKRGAMPRVVRLHELFRSSPRDVQIAALATVLRHVPAPRLEALRRRLREYVHAENARFVDLSRRPSLSPRASSAAGDHHDLEAVLATLFRSGVARPNVGPLRLEWT